MRHVKFVLFLLVFQNGSHFGKQEDTEDKVGHYCFFAMRSHIWAITVGGYVFAEYVASLTSLSYNLLGNFLAAFAIWSNVLATFCHLKQLLILGAT